MGNIKMRSIWIGAALIAVHASALCGMPCENDFCVNDSCNVCEDGVCIPGMTIEGQAVCGSACESYSDCANAGNCILCIDETCQHRCMDGSCEEEVEVDTAVCGSACTV